MAAQRGPFETGAFRALLRVRTIGIPHAEERPKGSSRSMHLIAPFETGAFRALLRVRTEVS
jgi:hypothetical protein